MEKAGWLPLAPADLAELCAIAARLHPGLPERPEVFAEKLRLFPEGCLKFTAGGAMAGYGLAHPWTPGAAPKLDSFLGALPGAPGCLYLHDAAVLPSARGLGAAASLVAFLERLARARGLGALALVSVYGTVPLWARYGFKTESPAGLDLASYGEGAAYMVKKL